MRCWRSRVLLDDMGRLAGMDRWKVDAVAAVAFYAQLRRYFARNLIVSINISYNESPLTIVLIETRRISLTSQNLACDDGQKMCRAASQQPAPPGDNHEIPSPGVCA